jgi:hypothetical protein
MNPELYTEEFRNFKYLKSPLTAVNYFKSAFEKIERVAPWANDLSNRRWPCRLEFLEQLLDLRNDTVYLVEPATIGNAYEVSDGRIYVFEKPFVYKGIVTQPLDSMEATIEDIPLMENPETNEYYYICSESYKNTVGTEGPCEGVVLKIGMIPLVPEKFCSYTAMFYDKEWAENYSRSINDLIRKKIGTISAFAQRL